jgi:hypothetical protein
MTPFIGFAPDLPPETPGVMTDCANILPGVGVFSAAPSKKDSGLGAVDGAAVGFAVVKKLDNTARIFCGTADKLYEGSTTWADKSKAGGYTLGPDDRWRFAQFGDLSIAVAGSVTMQSISSGAAFADVSASAPKAAIVEVLNNQVFVFNIDGMGFSADVTRWGCSAVGDATNWTPAIATQCVSGQLLDAPGPITAGRRLGDIIVAYKNSSMFVGQYVGVPQVWNFTHLPGEIGTPCQEAVVSVGTAHYFVGIDDFYLFDGSRAQPLESPVRQWFFSQLDPKYQHKIVGRFDKLNQRIYWWFPSKSGSGTIDKCVVLHIKTRQWGKMDGAIEVAAEYISPGVTYDGIGSIYSKYDDLPTTISYDSPSWSAAGSVLSVFGTDHKTYTFSGTPTASSITPGHYGDNLNFTTITRVTPRFLVSPTSSSLLYSYSNTDATAFTQNLSSTFINRWYDILWSALWHKVEMQYTGAVSISGIDVTLTQDGSQ